MVLCWLVAGPSGLSPDLFSGRPPYTAYGYGSFGESRVGRGLPLNSLALSVCWHHPTGPAFSSLGIQLLLHFAVEGLSWPRPSLGLCSLTAASALPLLFQTTAPQSARRTSLTVCSPRTHPMAMQVRLWPGPAGFWVPRPQQANRDPAVSVWAPVLPAHPRVSGPVGASAWPVVCRTGAGESPW